MIHISLTRVKFNLTAFLLLAGFLVYAQNDNTLSIPKTDNLPEYFELKKFTVKETAPQGDGYQATSDGVFYRMWDKKGVILEEYLRGKELISGHSYSPGSPLFSFYKEFYLNGHVKLKGTYCRLGFKTGKWYHYDKKGNLIKTEDTDSGFTFTEADIISFCKKNNISLEIKDFQQTIIGKSKNENNTFIWYILYYDSERPVIINYHLSAANGEIVKRWEEPFAEFIENVRH